MIKTDDKLDLLFGLVNMNPQCIAQPLVRHLQEEATVKMLYEITPEGSSVFLNVPTMLNYNQEHHSFAKNCLGWQGKDIYL